MRWISFLGAGPLMSAPERTPEPEEEEFGLNAGCLGRPWASPPTPLRHPREPPGQARYAASSHTLPSLVVGHRLSPSRAS